MLAYYTGGTGHPGKWRDGLHWHDHVLRKFPDWTVDDLVEVYNDPNQVVIRPDPKSKTGRRYKVIGWSARLGRVITLTMSTRTATPSAAPPVTPPKGGT